MAQVEWKILVILYDHNHIAVERVGKASLIQYVGVATSEITDHQTALGYRREDIIHNLPRTVNLFNSTSLESLAFASCLDYLIHRIKFLFERHHHSDVTENRQRPMLDIEEPWSFVVGSVFEESEKSFNEVTPFYSPVRAEALIDPVAMGWAYGNLKVTRMEHFF